MTDRERCEDESLKKCIQEAYGCTDEQLMDELNEIEESLSDSDFPDVEDRIMSRLMKRIEETAPEETENDVDESEEAAAFEYPELSDYTEKKTVRFGRKKILLAAVLAATFAGTLGVTAIGGKSYFFRERERESSIVFNSGKNKSDAGSLEEAYQKIEEEFGKQIFRLNHLPEGVQFSSLIVESEEKATIQLKYGENNLYFVQWKSGEEVSVNTGIEKEYEKYVENDWLNQRISYSESVLKDGLYEFTAQIKYSDTVACLFGKCKEDQFEKLLKNIFFY